jgi:hypothetical protein
MAYYEEMGIEAVSAGVITMRRRKGVPNWFRAGEAPERMAGQSGDAVLTGFALRDYLETVRDDSALLRERFRLPRSVLLEKRLEPSGEGWREASATLRLTEGLVYSGKVDRSAQELLAACDGRKRLDEILKGIADSLGADATTIAAPCCGVVRRLVEKGFLLPDRIVTV